MRTPPTETAVDDDLQRSPEQDPPIHRESSAVLQGEVVALVTSHQGRSADEALAEFQRRLSAGGLPAQPRRWMEAVAASAAEGRIYVVSEQALADVGVQVDALDVQKETPTEPSA